VGYHVTTYNNTIGVFKRILQDAVESGHLLANPAAKLKRLGKRRLALARNGEAGQPPTPEELKSPVLPSTDKPWYPSPKEFAAIVKKMRSYKFGPCQAAADFAELLCYSGCRLSEGNRLRWCDVDWKRNIIKVDGAKERANSESEIRDVPILPALAGLLRRLQKRPHQPTDKIARVSECRGTMQHACVDLKMPRKLDHHDLRHTFATRSVAAGVPVPVVSDWLGHKDGGVLLLETYRHEDQTVSQRWAKRVKL
jgi:integrase